MSTIPLCPTAEARVATIVQKAEAYAAWIASNQADSMAHEIAAKEDLCAAIRLALKEQDRDTRHACAEAVMHSAIQPVGCVQSDVLNRAHQACMNAHAV